MPTIVKNTTLPSLLDLIAPHSCRGCGKLGAPLCDRCKKYIISTKPAICPNCKSPTKGGKCQNCPDLPETYIVGERDELIGTLIHDFKFKSVRALAHPLAELAHATLPNLKGKTIIVPLPTINKHIRARGLDHTYLVAKHLTKLRNHTIQSNNNYETKNLLLRARNSIQVGTDRQTRLTQASKAYTLNPKLEIDKGATYILLDDVWTTGASLRAATDVLKKGGTSKVVLLILALSR